jgi:hypothetical protein
MEPAQTTITITCGEFECVEVLPLGAFRIKLGPGTSITVHVGDFPHRVKKGDMIPLFMEIPYEAKSTSIQ